MAAPRRVTVTTSATLIQDTTYFDAESVVSLQTQGDVYLGESGVSAANGWLLPAGSTIELKGVTKPVYGVVAAGTTVVSVWAQGGGS